MNMKWKIFLTDIYLDTNCLIEAMTYFFVWELKVFREKYCQSLRCQYLIEIGKMFSLKSEKITAKCEVCFWIDIISDYEK